MNGYPVGLISALSTFPAQKRIAMRAAKPRTPLRIVVAIIVRGTTVEAFGISSAACQQTVSAYPSKTNDPACKPIKKAYPYGKHHRRLAVLKTSALI